MDFDTLKKFFSKISPVSSTVDFLLTRAKLSKYTLKQKYSTVLRIGGLFGCILTLLSFYSLQRFENDIEIETEGQIIIENIAATVVHKLVIISENKYLKDLHE